MTDVTIHLVAVHGNGGGADRFARLPRPLARDVRLHTPTLPGFGGRPLGDVAGVADLAMALGAELPATDDPVVLLGHGIGGSVALELLAQDPMAVDGLILHAPVGTRLDTRWFPRLMAPAPIRDLVRWGISTPLLRPLWRRTLVRDVPWPWDEQFLAQYADAEAFGAMFEWLTSDWFDSLPPLDLPAMLLWGADDRVLGADQRSDYRRLLPAATERTVTGWGHFPMLVEPVRYGEVVASIARDLVGRATADGPLPLPRLGQRDRRATDAPAKAALLDRLHRAGLPVPDGLVVPADVLATTDVDAVAVRIAATLRGGEGQGHTDAPSPGSDARSPGSDARPSGTDVDARSPGSDGRPSGTDADAGPPGAATDAGAQTDEARHAGPDGRRPDATVAVRSAFATEDSAATANAGRYATVLGVPWADHAALAEAVATVLSSAEADTAHPTAGDDDGDAVPPEGRAVLVQRMVDARHAGVAFTQPAHEDDLVEVVDGLAEGLVGGEVEGERGQLARLTAGERPDDAGWRGRLQLLLRDVRDQLGDQPGTPGWDVEWADDGETCWLVQVRPITAPPRRDEVLTLANHREILPDPPSVLMTSLVVASAPATFDYWRSHSDDLPADRPFVEEFAGRPLINLSLLVDSMRRLGLPTALVTDSMGGSTVDDHVRVVGPRPRRLVRHLPALVGLAIDQLRAPTTARTAGRRLTARVADLGEGFTGALDAAVDVYVTVIRTMFALSTAVSAPLAVLQRLGISAEHHARHRSAGTRVWDDLDQLARLVDRDPDRRAALEDGRLPEDPVFAAAWERFLDDHRHRGVYESDLARPRYHEDPSPLFGVLLDGGEARSVPPRTTIGRLATPVWWQAARAITAREQLRSDAMRAFDVLRQRLLSLADDAAAAGLLPEPTDVWDCTLEQLRAVDDGTPVTPGALAATRARRERLAPLRLPDVVRRSDDPLAYAPAGAPERGTVIRGLPLTTGEVAGTAWRLDEPTGQRPPHDPPVVLVAPAVDAGWIATFARVDAVVVETGGELSHGSIVLRERAVPAVTNARGATAIADGTRLRVDAGAGTVEVDPSG